ncbi:LLM class flavin-dependent oxidoreductase [Cellulomonas alba]|uniref:LLM class flavin-dependent oxidoreductase n=1 Tax=Cellulomonas alba TaxID=3053467 RepID=A0ABT7SCQ3_9CELL|nr:LLM class flavin-dependent oxidoreductase [Cellulomonas alba]MDM7853972.1 LLM class flavin-dependent oxidoreductase [Cellulomonas alba]
MRFGITGTWGSPSELLEVAVEAERAGWDGWFTWDGVSLGDWPSWAPWTLLGAAAQATSRLRLGAVVFAPGRRLPWELVRDVLTVDHLSGGRLVLPVGLGVTDDAAVARVRGLPSAARDRAALLDESLEFLERALRGEKFSFDGAAHGIEDAHFLPLPVQRPRPPVWVVGAWPSDRSLARAARWDGVLLQRLRSEEPWTPEDAARAVTRVHELRAEQGLPDEPYDVVLDGTLPTDRAERADRLAALAEAGVTWWIESHWAPATKPADLLALARGGPPA